LVDLDDLAERARSRHDFVRFLQALRADLLSDLSRPASELAWGGGEWAHTDLEAFLETFAAALEDTERFDRLPPVAWQGFAEMLLTARVHE
jgi:hypothetical protein